jgi:hypothetical protein
MPVQGMQALPRLVADAEAALAAANLGAARSSLDALFAEAQRGGAGTLQDQHMCRAHFAAGQLVSRLTSAAKGEALVAGVLEALGHIMQGVALAAPNPRCASSRAQQAVR